MKRNKLIVIMVCGFMFLSSGCVKHAATKTHVEAKSMDTTHPRAKLVLGSKKLLKKIVLTNVRIGPLGNFQRAEVDLQNLVDTRFSLEYRFEWQDSQGFTVNANNAWHRVTLGPMQIKNLKTVGKVPEAYKIQLIVRYPDDIFIESHKREQEEKKR